MNKNIIYTLFLAVFSCFNSFAAGVYEQGREYDAVVPGSGTSMKIYVPANYESSRKWPLILFYHGMNGSPTTDCITRHCAGSDFIVAGLTYCEKTDTGMTREQHNAYIEKERMNFRAAVGWVKQNLSLDTKRVFLGGVSKGGWTTSIIGERELKNLAGFIILLAGRQRGAVPGPQKMTGFPVYIGAGENDPNILAAVHGAGFYRHCGANTTLDVFPGLGHQVPQKAELLSRWLEAYGPLSHPWIDAKVIEDRKSAYKKSYEAALGNPDKEKSCKELQELLKDPRLVVVCGIKTRNAIEAKLNALAKTQPAVAKELTAERSFYDIVWREWNMQTIDDITAVIEGYSRLEEMAPDTSWAGYAQKSHDRLIPMYNSALKQMEGLKSRNKNRQQQPFRTKMRNSSGTGGVSIF